MARLYQAARKSAIPPKQREADTNLDPFPHLKASRLAYRDEDYPGALAHALKFGARAALRRLAALGQGNEMISIDFDNPALEANTQLGIWVWLMAEAAKNAESLANEMARIDTLLIVYFVGARRRPAARGE